MNKGTHIEPSNKKVKKKKVSLDFLYLTPWIIGLVLFTLIPYIFSLYISFTKYNMIGTPKWIGLKNYIEIFKDDMFYQTLWVTLKYVIISVPLKVGFSLFVAVILKNKIKGASFFRTIYYIPSLLGSSVAISVIWKAIFTKDGLFNNILAIFGIKGIEWIGTPSTSLLVLALLSMWQFGSSMLIFLAGLNQIPQSVLDAAEVDGAFGMKRFLKITFPLITPVVFFNLVMQMINSFQTFTAAFVVTNGGPVNSTLLYVLYIYQKGFQTHNFGYASALSWILLAVILSFTIIIFKTQKKWVYYDN